MNKNRLLREFEAPRQPRKKAGEDKLPLPLANSIAFFLLKVKKNKHNLSCPPASTQLSRKIEDRRRETGDGRQETGDGSQKTGDKSQET